MSEALRLITPMLQRLLHPKPLVLQEMLRLLRLFRVGTLNPIFPNMKRDAEIWKSLQKAVMNKNLTTCCAVDFRWIRFKNT